MIDDKVYRSSIKFSEYLDAAGLEFQARIERAKQYQHPTGIGDAREDAVRQYLQEVLPSRFCVERGKIFDSNGRLSREFDVIISERKEIAPIMQISGRRIVPIESVYGVLEIKSILGKKEFQSFWNSTTELHVMRRFYVPKHDVVVGKKDELEQGYGPMDGMGKIWSGLIAFQFSANKQPAYFDQAPGSFLFVCEPGKRILHKSTTGNWIRADFKLSAFPFLVWLIMDLVTSSKRSQLFAPDYRRYRKTIFQALMEQPSDSDCR